MSRTVLYFLVRIVVASLLFAVQWYLYKRTRVFFDGGVKKFPRTPAIVASVFLLFNFPLFLLVFIRISTTAFPIPFLYCGVYPFFVWHAATFFIFLMLSVLRILKLPLDVLLLTSKAISPLNKRIVAMKSTSSFTRFDDSRRAFLKTGALVMSGYSFIGATKGIVDRDDFDVVERTVLVRGLPDEFKGFTIGLMSDIHSSVFMTKPEMDTYVNALNALKTDVIFVPGDFVNSQTEEVYPFAEAFSALRAPSGVYGCLGNHDYFANVDVVAKEVDACGVKLLRNDAVKIWKGSSYINVLGVDDIPMSGTPETFLGRALTSAQNDQPKILLCHKPYFLETFAAHNIDLTLSGHTHGGQIVFAKIGNTIVSLASLFSKYVWGLYQFNDAQMYVTRGIGTVGVPFRINCPPEITKITLR